MRVIPLTHPYHRPQNSTWPAESRFRYHPCPCCESTKLHFLARWPYTIRTPFWIFSPNPHAIWKWKTTHNGLTCWNRYLGKEEDEDTHGQDEYLPCYKNLMFLVQPIPSVTLLISYWCGVKKYIPIRMGNTWVLLKSLTSTVLQNLFTSSTNLRNQRTCFQKLRLNITSHHQNYLLHFIHNCNIHSKNSKLHP